MLCVLFGKRFLFSVVAILPAGCTKNLVMQVPEAARAALAAGDSSIGNPEIVLNVNNVETIEINPGGDIISPANNCNPPISRGEFTRQQAEMPATILKASPDVQIRLEGRCYEQGSDEYNPGLGDRRAVVVLEPLAGLGLHEQRMAAVSFGIEKPACSEAAEQCRQRNEGTGSKWPV